MVGLLEVKKIVDMYNRLHTKPACDGQTDRRTERRTDGQTDRHLAMGYAYASRGKNGVDLPCRFEI